ncbi:hypothetical protein M9H77_23565 [Catharanthus roseus]|uniref:Uncharacterized protein n=1 Tax=Catharanthus roseus TaxID=4058 RepID=A0ACC0ATA3_CATRO|nr:hypothetical protein M9H77_23565 [Catharanthus roseus]
MFSAKLVGSQDLDRDLAINTRSTGYIWSWHTKKSQLRLTVEPLFLGKEWGRLKALSLGSTKLAARRRVNGRRSLKDLFPASRRRGTQTDLSSPKQGNHEQNDPLSRETVYTGLVGSSNLAYKNFSDFLYPVGKNSSLTRACSIPEDLLWMLT